MNGDNVDIDWESARLANQENWEDRAPVHEEAYGLDAFDDPAHLSDVVRDDLVAMKSFLPSGSLSGLDLCHLQCHIGTDTVSLARAGATVTGVDFSPSALRAAAQLAARLGIDATWVETDVLDARAAVDGDFDVVYTSIGTITWLSDLDRWAAQIVALLRPGGMFFIRDGHPALYALDENAAELTTRYSYFATGHAQQWDDDGTYVGDGRLAHTRTYEWPHPLSEILGALLRAGLRLIHFDEGRTLPWCFSDRMVEVPGGYAWPDAERDKLPWCFSDRMVEVPGGYAWPDAERDKLPCTYTIIARRD